MDRASGEVAQGGGAGVPGEGGDGPVGQGPAEHGRVRRREPPYGHLALPGDREEPSVGGEGEGAAVRPGEVGELPPRGEVPDAYAGIRDSGESRPPLSNARDEQSTDDELRQAPAGCADARDPAPRAAGPARTRRPAGPRTRHDGIGRGRLEQQSVVGEGTQLGRGTRAVHDVAAPGGAQTEALAGTSAAVAETRAIRVGPRTTAGLRAVAPIPRVTPTGPRAVTTAPGEPLVAPLPHRQTPQPLPALPAQHEGLPVRADRAHRCVRQPP